MYGFMDESGSPGVANGNDSYFLVSLVVFDSKKKMHLASEAVNKLRKELSLTEDYEFHCSKNSARSQKAFISLLKDIEFGFITIAIQKNHNKSTASYKRISEIIVNIVIQKFPNIKIVMDSNPVFYAELRQCFRFYNLKKSNIRQVKSHTNNLVQIADYVVNLSAKKVRKRQKAQKQYKFICEKEVDFIEIKNKNPR